MERLEQANTYLKEMAYKKVRDLFVRPQLRRRTAQGARSEELRFLEPELSGFRRRVFSVLLFDPFEFFLHSRFARADVKSCRKTL